MYVCTYVCMMYVSPQEVAMLQHRVHRRDVVYPEIERLTRAVLKLEVQVDIVEHVCRLFDEPRIRGKYSGPAEALEPEFVNHC